MTNVLAIVLGSLFVVFGLRAFVDFVEELITMFLKIALVGTAVVLFITAVQYLI